MYCSSSSLTDDIPGILLLPRKINYSIVNSLRLTSTVTPSVIVLTATNAAFVSARNNCNRVLKEAKFLFIDRMRQLIGAKTFDYRDY